MVGWPIASHLKTALGAPNTQTSHRRRSRPFGVSPTWVSYFSDISNCLTRTRASIGFAGAGELFEATRTILFGAPISCGCDLKERSGLLDLKIPTPWAKRRP